MQKPQRIDFVALVNDLIRVGMTLPEMAAALGVSKGLPYHWLSGGEPGHYNGVLLLALHAHRCNVQHIEQAGAEHCPARAGATAGNGDVPVPSEVGGLYTDAIDTAVVQDREGYERGPGKYLGDWRERRRSRR